MFKVESYIAPILLSYFDKYIKNFKLEDSQVSLWGGDAAFHNLDLRLEVLEQELQSPFSFISGHIRELFIHVPWTKLTSEPITVTINTIECVLKLKEVDTAEQTQTKDRPKKSSSALRSKQEVEAPPNYVQQLINKIVNNIRIHCNNVILKYVEEDIVLSMNVKHLKLESCNEKWEAAFVDVSPTKVKLRKVIAINDLTICLDKRNASGKIDVYQEPMLYRCSMTMHLLRIYNSATVNKTSLLHLDIYCNNMEFSVTEQQVPMFLRILLLLFALQQKQLKSSSSGNENSGSPSESKDASEHSETWGGWAWSYLSAVLPTQWDEDSDEEQLLDQTGHTAQIGFYVDTASLTFKVSESNSDKGYYSQKKIRYNPVITLQLQGIYSELQSVGMKWFNSAFGISEALLLPIGSCTCSHTEISDGSVSTPYLKIGTSKENNEACTNFQPFTQSPFMQGLQKNLRMVINAQELWKEAQRILTDPEYHILLRKATFSSRSTTHKDDSLFDPEALENNDKLRIYNTDWDFHLNSKTEAVFLERTPALACDYIYQMEVPDDTTSELFSELGSNFEYSNFSERSLASASRYDYLPYYSPKADPLFQELLPASSEDFDALSEFIPTRSYKVTLINPVIELQYMDHPVFVPTKDNLFRRRKKHSVTWIPTLQLEKLPKLTLECKLVEFNLVNPMYVNRLVHTTSQLPNPPSKMFDACYSKQDINLIGLCSRLMLKPDNVTTIIVPFNLSYQRNTILKPQYWLKPDIPHAKTQLVSENMTLNGTKAKLMVVKYLVEMALKRGTDKCIDFINTSLLFDATKDQGLPYLEFCVEGLTFKKIVTNSTTCFDVTLGAVKAFVFEALDESKNNIQQVLFLSGPEPKAAKSHKSSSEEVLLFTATIQYPLNSELQKHPSLFVFDLQEIKICIDPLLCKWLLYKPIDINLRKSGGSEQVSSGGKTFSETYGSTTETPRRNQIESVHSSSDRDLLQKSSLKLPKILEEERVDFQENVNVFLNKWYQVWKAVIFNGNISHCTIFFPMTSISAVGSQGIDEAVQESVKKGSNVMVIALPLASIQSAQKQNLTEYVIHLPVTLPQAIWNYEKPSFPWHVSVSDLNCYTMQMGKKMMLLNPVCLNASIGLSTKPTSDISVLSHEITSEGSRESLGHFGVYVHIDMSPIIVSTCESQIYLLASILCGLTEIYSSMLPVTCVTIQKTLPDALPPIVTGTTTSLSPTNLDGTSENTLPVDEREISADLSDSGKLTVLIQWTITKFSFELLSENRVEERDAHPMQLKLIFDIEDIVTSLDYQSVYLKLKSKIGSVSVRHFQRKSDKTKWNSGPFAGVIMRLREDVRVEKYEENGFITATLTRASSHHTHHLWGALKKTKQEKRASQLLHSVSRYITEIVVNIQPIDLVFPLKTLRGFYAIVSPLLKVSRFDKPDRVSTTKPVAWFNNQALPLAYLECQDIRIIIPSAKFCGNGPLHNVYIMQVGKINLSPSVANPICRTPTRPDIYRQAAQSGILNIPGSEIEDRQYQFDICGLSVSTATWEDLDHVLNMRGIVSRGVNENPALEWNNLEQGQLSIIPILSLKHVIERVDICIVAAPTMLYKHDIVICGNSFEVNFVSDIDIFLSLDHLKLVAALLDECFCDVENRYLNENIFTKPKIPFPYSRFDKYAHFDSSVEIEMTEFYRDSGIDTSDIRSVLSARSQIQTNIPQDMVSSEKKSRQQISVSSPEVFGDTATEVLFTAGRIGCSLYQICIKHSSLSGRGKTSVRNEEKDYEASEEESVDESSQRYQEYLPLLYFSIAQPNAFFSRQTLTTRVQISCFDIITKLNNSELIPNKTIPTNKDFPVTLIETRPGSPDPITGIPPELFTLKYLRELSKQAIFELGISRPTKVTLSTVKISYLLSVKNRIVENFPFAIGCEKEEVRVQEHIKGVSLSKFRRMKEALRGIEYICVQTGQLMFVFESETGSEIAFAVGKAKSDLSLSDRPERLHNTIRLECLTFCVTNNSVTKILLKPWTVSVDFNAIVEPWQSSDSDPQIRVVVHSGCIFLDVSPEDIRSMQNVVKELREYASSLSLSDSYENGDDADEEEVAELIEKDQYYKDDLRAGAFQFIDANMSCADEMPLPYQVMFWNDEETSAMAWKYPQPRALTKVRVFPVPFESTSVFQNNSQVSCNLQYWSDLFGGYVSYAQFFLSESEVFYLDLPKSEPQQAVACTWRVVLTPFDDDVSVSISPKALVACMRIDSYFNRNLVPNFTCVVDTIKVELSFNTNFPKTATVIEPKCLKDFTPDFEYPDSNCFLKLEWEHFKLHLASWNMTMMALDISTIIQCSVLDYTFLTERTLLQKFGSQIKITLSETLNCSANFDDIQLLFGPCTTHTLGVNAQMWSQAVDSDEPRNFVVFSRYVVCNDTNVILRFGQVSTDEDILLGPRYFHLYCWRSQKAKQQLRVAFEEEGWVWSEPFAIDTDGVKVVQISGYRNMCAIVHVKSLSATQKQVTVSGQLVIANMLCEQFEFKIVQNEKEDARNATVHLLDGKSVTPSMMLQSKSKYFLCLRFHGLESAWTGYIPLQEHAKGTQPWLVKVALQERGQFLSIWCRIVVEHFDKCKRILAMLWPLFALKSNLPVPLKMHIETPSLNIHLDSVVQGKGKIQQLYCPGTTDHSHHLSFKLEDGTSISDSYIPLDYSRIDRNEFFKRDDKESICDILNCLKYLDESKWPYFGEDLDDATWVVDDQPQLAVWARYQNAFQYSSALLVELLPWCLMVNTLGCPISIMANGEELCRISQNGIMAPPKLDENFHLGIESGNRWCYSSPLQLAKSDWSQTFYMPKISGSLTEEGNMKTAIRFGNHLCMVSVTSSVTNEIRLLKLSSTHVFSNHLVTQIQVACFAVPATQNVFDLPTNLETFAFSVAPHSNVSHSGIPIVQWYLIEENCDLASDMFFYVSFALKEDFGWSCPISVDKSFSRKSLYVMSGDNSLPLVLSSQEYKGQIYLSLYHDDRPQTLIDNRSSVNLYCAQSTANSEVAVECLHFKWFCQLKRNTVVSYTMPFVSEKFPELPQVAFSERIVFACPVKEGIDNLQWSVPVTITNDSEQFIRIPSYDDVKLTVKITAYATLLTIKPVSQVEISAIDIRGRLSMHEMLSSSPSNRHEASIPIDVEKNMEEPNSKVLLKSSSGNSLYESLFQPTLPLNDSLQSINVLLFVKSFSMILVSDQRNDLEEQNIASITLDYIGFEVTQAQNFTVDLVISDIQFDNLLYSNESYDFPVVLVNQVVKARKNVSILNMSSAHLLNDARVDPLLVVELNMETWKDDFRHKNMRGVKDIKVTLNPLSCYVEDVYITRLTDYVNTLLPLKMTTNSTKLKSSNSNTNLVKVPEVVGFQSSLAVHPINIRNISIGPLSLLLSVHSSLKMYIALDQSPLQFGRFERKRLLTTPYRLGHSMTMHYLSGAIFGAGWVVSSLELLGSPSGLARAMGTGLRDFVSLPYRGLIQGPWAFVAGITHGSASLMKHVTAGTLQSVTKMASSVARNLDRLTLDEEHLRRTEEQRRYKPQGLTQGFMQGLTGLGISILGAVGGIAHHPLQSIMSDNVSPQALAAGVGRGLVGVITKPLSGAAELVALTGQGLLQGAGWNHLPVPRYQLLSNASPFAVNSLLKYEWKLLRSVTQKNILCATEATQTSGAVLVEVALILTSNALVVINTNDDVITRIINLSQLQIVKDTADRNLLCFKIITAVPIAPPIEDDGVIEMDPVSRARVADYVRSTASLLQHSDDHSEHKDSPLTVQESTEEYKEQLLHYRMCPAFKDYFICLFLMTKQQSQINCNFSVL